MSASLVASNMLGIPAAAQDFSRGLATADRYFYDGILPADLASLVDPTLGGQLKGVIGYNLSVGVSYDSNINLSSVNQEDDIFLSINPGIFYSSDPEGGARHSITAYYSPKPEIFQNNSENARFNNNAGIYYRFAGSRTSISAFLDYTQSSAPDRFTNGFSEGSLLSYGLRASYQLAPRTEIFGSLSSSYSTYETPGEQGADFLTARFGGFWAATERLSIGPTVDLNVTDSVNTGKVTRIGGSLNARFVATEKLNLRASIGVDEVNYSLGVTGDSARISGNLDFSYVINPLWTWNGSITYANIPSPITAGLIINDWEIAMRLRRSLDVGSLGFVATYSFSDFQSIGFVPGVVTQNGSYYLVGVNYGRPFISERITFSTSLFYQESTGQANWSKWVLSCSWGTSF
ncbi:hypothetical protein [Haloferula sp.]|uniref:hypothetical protein n=1 Tax=Haloferula sp. TaxID=2497595 RepID=UPI003C70D8D3